MLGHEACVHGTVGAEASRISKAKGTTFPSDQQCPGGPAAVPPGWHLVASVFNLRHPGGGRADRAVALRASP